MLSGRDDRCSSSAKRLLAQTVRNEKIQHTDKAFDLDAVSPFVNGALPFLISPFFEVVVVSSVA
jgi:hypothetical protein